MSRSPSKLRGGAKVSPVTRLKELCLKKPEVRDELWAWHDSPELTNAAIRGRIEARWGIQLARDGQLSPFWDWLRQMRRQDRYNANVERFEQWYKQQNPEASVEKVRQMGIAFFMSDAMADEDRDGFKDMAYLDLQERSLKSKAAFEERKVSVSERRVAVLEKKAAQADQAKGLLQDKALTPAEREARMKQVFGIS